MRQAKKFDRSKYLQDLEKVQQTIVRVRSNSKSSQQMSRNPSQKALHQNTSYSNLTKKYSYKCLAKQRNEYGKEYFKVEDKGDGGVGKSELVKTKNKTEWSVKNRSSGTPMLGETTKLEKCISNLKKKIHELDEQFLEPQQQPKTQKITQKNTFVNKQQERLSSETIFIKHLNSLYNIQSATPGDASNIKKITRQIQLRDDVYDIVQQGCTNLDTKNPEKAIEQWFEKKQMMLQIIGIYKNISKVDIENCQDLYNFLKEGSE